MKWILFLDDNPERWAVFVKRHPGERVLWASTVAAAIEQLSARDFDLISLDHDLCPHDENLRSGFMMRTGLDVAEFLAQNPERSPRVEIVVHDWNDWGAYRMIKVLADAGRKVDREAFDYGV